MPLIFEQFYTTWSKSIGLGLPFCKKIIQLHHGPITIDSDQNQGIMMRLVLPSRTGEKEVHEKV